MADPGDAYEEYNCDESVHTSSQSRKGKSKKEADLNKHQHGYPGHERKIAEKIGNAEEKRKEERKAHAEKWNAIYTNIEYEIYLLEKQRNY